MSIDMLCKIINTAYHGEEAAMKDLSEKFDKLLVGISRHMIGIPATKIKYDAMLN